MAAFARWIGKIAVVTGAGSGMGAAIAQKLVLEGIQVVGLDLDKQNVEKLAAKLAAEKGKLYALKCDVSKEDEVLKAFKWVSENVGTVHILVNCAGIVSTTNLIEGDSDQWRKLFEVNVFGVLVATREAVKIMRENNIDGHIIHINSITGHYDIYTPTMSVYPATKHVITNLTETLRKEFNAHNLKIKITSVSPGITKTNIVMRNGKIAPEWIHEPMLESEDIADAVYYALSTKPHVQVHEIMLRPMGAQD